VIELDIAADFGSTYSLPGQDVFREAATALDLLSDRSQARRPSRSSAAAL
jgi:hypothetical protein